MKKDIEKPKTSRGFKTVMWIIGIIAGVPLLIVLSVLLFGWIYITSLDAEKDRLQEETTNVFSSAPFSLEEFYCGHGNGVNDCSFIINDEAKDIRSYLVENGFSATSEYEYVKNGLRIYGFRSDDDPFPNERKSYHSSY